MDDAARTLIEAIHGTPTQAVLAVSGAGSQALAWLLGVGGASRTVLEATVPYVQSSFVAYAGTTPGEFASPEAAVALARASLQRARGLSGASTLVGIGCAATIATDRLKRGEHRAYVAASEGERTRVWALHIEKGARDRPGEEDLVSRVVVNALAGACGLELRLPLGLRAGEALSESEA
ncbi:MAG: hypothetical protein IT299_13375 [Dehalococcoidia bacterium]|nr:hypothetical protein [Dehalococcoidia bacterium]